MNFKFFYYELSENNDLYLLKEKKADSMVWKGKKEDLIQFLRPRKVYKNRHIKKRCNHEFLKEMFDLEIVEDDENSFPFFERVTFNKIQKVCLYALLSFCFYQIISTVYFMLHLLSFLYELYKNKNIS